MKSSYPNNSIEVIGRKEGEKEKKRER